MHFAISLAATGLLIIWKATEATNDNTFRINESEVLDDGRREHRDALLPRNRFRQETRINSQSHQRSAQKNGLIKYRSIHRHSSHGNDLDGNLRTLTAESFIDEDNTFWRRFMLGDDEGSLLPTASPTETELLFVPTPAPTAAPNQDATSLPTTSRRKF